MADPGGEDIHNAGWEQLSAVMGADRSADVRAAGLAWLWVADAVEAQLVVLEQGRRELVPRWRSAAGEEFLARLAETVRALRDTAAVARHNHRVMDAAADDLSRAQRDFAAVAAAPLSGAERDEAGRAIVRALDGRYEQAIAEFREVPPPPGTSGAVPSGLSRGSGALSRGPGGLPGEPSIAGPTGSPTLAGWVPQRVGGETSGSAAPSGPIPPGGVVPDRARPGAVRPGVVPPGVVPPERTGPGPILGGAPPPRPAPGTAPAPVPGNIGQDPDIGGAPVREAPGGGAPVSGAPIGGGAPEGGTSATTGRRTGQGVVPGVGVGPPVPGARTPVPPAGRGPMVPGVGAGPSPGAVVTPTPAVPGGAATPWTSPSSAARPRATDAPRQGQIQPAPTPMQPASAAAPPASPATPRPASVQPHRVEATTTRYVDGQGNRITIRRSAGDSRIGSVGGAPATAQRAESRDTGGAAGGA